MGGETTSRNAIQVSPGIGSSTTVTTTIPGSEIILEGETESDIGKVMADAFAEVEFTGRKVVEVAMPSKLYTTLHKCRGLFGDVEAPTKLWGASVVVADGLPSQDLMVLRGGNDELGENTYTKFRVCLTNDKSVLDDAVSLLPEPTIRSLARVVRNLFYSARNRADQGSKVETVFVLESPQWLALKVCRFYAADPTKSILNRVISDVETWAIYRKVSE